MLSTGQGLTQEVMLSTGQGLTQDDIYDEETRTEWSTVEKKSLPGEGTAQADKSGP